MKYDTTYLTNEAVRLLKAWMEIPSASGEEAELAAHVQQYLEAAGMNSGRTGNNVWSLSPNFDLQRPVLLLATHLDTPRPAPGWRRTPHTVWEGNGKLYGLGSNNAKASLVCLLQVFLQLCRTRQAYNLVFLACGEGLTLGASGLPAALKQLPPPDFALVGGPTGMQPAIAEKGWMCVEACAGGKGGSAARGSSGNAIYAVLEDLAWVKEQQFDRMSELLGPVTLQVTRIEGGSDPQRVPESCRYTLDLRPNEHYTCAELLETLQSRLKARINATEPCLDATHTDASHPMVARAIRLGRIPFGSPQVSEQALTACPSLKMGPGKSARSGGPDEFIFVQELEEAIEIYWKLLDGATL